MQICKSEQCPIWRQHSNKRKVRERFSPNSPVSTRKLLFQRGLLAQLRLCVALGKSRHLFRPQPHLSVGMKTYASAAEGLQRPRTDKLQRVLGGPDTEDRASLAEVVETPSGSWNTRIKASFCVLLQEFSAHCCSGCRGRG